MKSLLLLCVLLGQALPVTLMSQTVSQSQTASAAVTPTAAIERLLTAPQIQADWFAESFLQAIPLAQVEQIITELKSSLGQYQSIQPIATGYSVIFERGSVSTQIALNPEGQIIGLFFQTAVQPITPDQAVSELKTFPGQVSLLVLENDTELANLNADQPLAVGSAFKLAVLAALQQQINAGQRDWADIETLQSSDKSLPSGILQDWFDGARLTVESLATLMISQSDNTATDLLIRLVGRENVEAFSPRNCPFLTTREVSLLKAKPNVTLLQQYQAGDEATRRAILPQLAQLPLPGLTDLSPYPYALDVEWYFTAQELCQLIGTVADLPVMQVNSEFINTSQWSQVAYKGGSESGVLNLTTQLKSADKTYCVVATWNDSTAPVDEEQLVKLYQNILAGLKER